MSVLITKIEEWINLVVVQLYIYLLLPLLIDGSAFAADQTQHRYSMKRAHRDAMAAFHRASQ